MTVAERPVEPLHRRLGVTDDELDAIRDRLHGRDPNDLELAMFSVMWSEHCSYKSSKPLLRTLPTEGEGVVDIGGSATVIGHPPRPARPRPPPWPRCRPASG